MKIVIYSNTFYLVSGGDVIYANLAKKFLNFGHEVKIITNEKGYEFCLSQKVPQKAIVVQNSSWVDKFPLVFVELYKTTISTIREVLYSRDKPDIIFSSSFFWADLIPAVIAKIKHPKAKLIVGVYLIFPSPFSFKRYHGGQIKLFLHYLSQSLSLSLIRIFSNLVLTASEKDIGLYKNAIAIRGGVDIQQIKKVKARGKKFDLVYYGRFHSQKGILDMLDIWKNIKLSRPTAKFLMIGAGPLQNEILEKSDKLGIKDSITFTGVMVGTKKYKYLKSCRVFTSASRFDTGNMALDETLACGVPGVVYDLKYFYYPKGVIKIPVGRKTKMKNAILKLLNNTYTRSKLGKEGKNFIKQYDWENISQKILNTFFN